MAIARRVLTATAAGALLGGMIAAPAQAAGQAPPSPSSATTAGAASVTAQARKLTLARTGSGTVTADNHIKLTGTAPGGRKVKVQLQRRKAKAASAQWRKVAVKRGSGAFTFKHVMPQGRHSFRAVVARNGKDLVSNAVTVRATEAPFTSLTMPQDAQKVLDAISGAEQSVEIVVYQIGAADLLGALQQAKKNLAKNNPSEPVIRIMTNNQWYAKPATNFAYVTKIAQALGVGANGKSADGVVQFNYSANNFSLTHQKTILIDTLRPDGTDYDNASQLPASAQAIVATFNLQAYGWSKTDTGCSTNPGCTFVGGGPGTRDFGMVTQRPTDIWEVQQVYASDFAGPTPTETNVDLGLNDPTSNLVWSNGATGVLFPAPVGTGTPTGALYSQTASAYPAATADAARANGQYPAPYYLFAKAAKASPQVALGTTMGNANQVHLNTIEAAEAAAKAGKPATLYIYNEEYNDDAVLYAIQDAAAAGAKIRIMMTYGSTNGYNYDDLLQTTLTTGGEPVDAQVHLLPNQSPQYMYVHAKMIYADLGGNDSDVAFVGSQNFSENSLLFNREAGVQLKQSDGTLSDGVRTTLLNNFAADFAIDGKGVTWNYTDKSGTTHTGVPCPAIWLTPTNLWKPMSSGLDSSGCQLVKPSAIREGTSQASPNAPMLGSRSSSVEAWRDTAYPFFGNQDTAVGSSGPSFAAPLAGVSSAYYPQMPQGPINPTNMVPGPCQVVDQATGTLGAPCPAS